MGRIAGVVSPLTMQDFGAWSLATGLTEDRFGTVGQAGYVVLTAASSASFAIIFRNEEEARSWAKHSQLTIA